jgi:hypothetical protein
VAVSPTLERTVFIAVTISAIATLAYVKLVRDSDGVGEPTRPAIEVPTALLPPPRPKPVKVEPPGPIKLGCEDFQAFDVDHCSREQAAAAEKRYADKFVRWGYYAEPTNRTAFVYSRNEVAFDASAPTVPGRAHLRITQGDGSLDVTISTDRVLHPGKVRCDQACPLATLFDRGPMQTFTGSGNGAVITVIDGAQFLSILRGSKKLSIVLPLEGLGDTAFEFDVSGLVF